MQGEGSVIGHRLQWPNDAHKESTMSREPQSALHTSARRWIESLPKGGRGRRRLLQGAYHGALLCLLAVMGAGATWAQGITCPSYTQAPLQPLPEIQAQNGVLSTTFTVQEQAQCVPVWDATNGQWTMQAMTLRTYDWPGAPTDTQPPRRIPGPTLRVRRASRQGATDGDRLQINLINRLPVSTTPDTQCDTCPAGIDCTDRPDSAPPMCCTVQDRYPECFHGDNTTNLHFHGTHVSPQAPQDYVLLELMPEGSKPSDAHAHGNGTTAIGQYQYAVNMFPWDQAEGTHWYHPHKHGSVGLQLSNGMSGALLIVGPFDDWLNGFYQSQGGLTEQVLVIQQLDTTLNFYRRQPKPPSPALAPPQPLINGQANPIITMQQGEVQRWRFAAETTTGTTQLELIFPPGFTVKQIAQDGVQFAPQNYQNQPLLQPNFTLAPGNRADFLVQAPARFGSQPLTFRVVGNVAESVRQGTQVRQQRLAQSVAATTPPLLTIQVSNTSKPMSLPSQGQWPQMPSFLADVQDSELINKNNPRQVIFSMQGNPGQQPNAFFINQKQFDPSCVNLSMQLGTAEEWVVQNSSAPNHPFHIHTNPFQITQVGTQPLPAPWIWWDTFALPSQQDNTNGSMTIRQRFRDYTGEYVIHCHFLGHEDRGMMLATQTVCPPVQGQPPGFAFYGTPQAGGQPDACQPQDLKPAKSLCPGS
jgi:FtsP/CotA-like multicopper oxidase with cupredoxin domain